MRTSAEVYKVGDGRKTRKYHSYCGKKQEDKGAMGSCSKVLKCKLCKKNHVMKKEVCPAWGKTCNACHKEKHFKGSQSCHKAKKVYAIGDAEDSEITDEQIIMSLNRLESVRAITSKAVYCEMQIQQTLIKLQIDSGATVNIMPHHLVPVLYKLNACNITLKMWNKTTMDALG